MAKMKTTVLKTDENSAGSRLDVFVGEKLEISRSLAQTLIEDGGVRVNGCNSVKNYRIKGGETIEITVPDAKKLEAEPENIPVTIVYEDEYLLVADKPKGMVVHPAFGNKNGTLVNALLHHCDGRLSSINGVIRPGIVHRIDKDTSGLLIVAKTDDAHNGLAVQIANHLFTRRYEAICDGIIKEDKGTINLPIGRSEKDRKKMAVSPKRSREAVTHWRVINRYRGYTHVELTLETGRTHQIRVHLSHMGHPVTGDAVYGKAKNPFGLDGQCLFAKYISFIHPITKKSLSLEAAYPEYFIKTLDKLDKVFQNS
ncbi:MAG: RluA family pseudouridine synthase [Victivallales bacterium]